MGYPSEIYKISKKSKIKDKEIEKKYDEAKKEAKSMGKDKDEKFVLEILKSLIDYKESVKYKRYVSIFETNSNSMNSTNFGPNVRPSYPMYYPKDLDLNLSKEIYKKQSSEGIPERKDQEVVQGEYDSTWQDYVDGIPYSEPPENVDKKYNFAKDVIKGSELGNDVQKDTKIKVQANESTIEPYKSFFEDDGAMTSQSVGTTPEHAMTKKQLKKKKKKKNAAELLDDKNDPDMVV
jgi:hypothetical protein